jgi:hypothetical protein
MRTRWEVWAAGLALLAGVFLLDFRKFSCTLEQVALPGRGVGVGEGFPLS